MPAQTPHRVIRAYYGIAGLYTLSAATIWGINTLFLLDAGLDLLGVFIANTAFALGNVLFEIPTGVLADTRGRRLSFLLSVVILLVTTLGYVAIPVLWGGHLVAFCVVSVFMGLGFTFYSGAVEAWLVDALKATGFSGQLDRVFARGAMVTGTAMLVGTIGGGFLGNFDLSWPYLARGLMLAGVFIMAWFMMREHGFTPRTIAPGQLSNEMKRVARASLEHGWQQRSVRLLMLCSLIQMGFLTWGFHAYQPYFLGLLGKEDAVWVSGVVAALISLSTIGGNLLVDVFSRFCGKRSTLLIWASIVQTLAAIGVGLAGSFWLAVACFLFVTAAMGVIIPTKQAYLHTVIPTEQRASVISLDSMLGNIGSGASQMGLGHLTRQRSLADGYVVGGLVTLLSLPTLILLRRLGEPADRLIGDDCQAPEAPCAGQGLVDAQMVDATSRRGET